MVRRLKPTKAMKRYKRSASSSDYAKMQAAASAVVIANRNNQYRTGNPEYVLFRMPFWTKFADDFPKGHIVAKDMETNTWKINAVKLLNWLHEHGHSEYNSSMLVRQTTAYELLSKEVDNLLSLDGQL